MPTLSSSVKSTHTFLYRGSELHCDDEREDDCGDGGENHNADDVIADWENNNGTHIIYTQAMHCNADQRSYSCILYFHDQRPTQR